MAAGIVPDHLPECKSALQKGTHTHKCMGGFTSQHWGTHFQDTAGASESPPKAEPENSHVGEK